MSMSQTKPVHPEALALCCSMMLLRKTNGSKFLDQRGLGWNVQHPCALLPRQNPLIPPLSAGAPPKQGLAVCPCPEELLEPCPVMLPLSLRHLLQFFAQGFVLPVPYPGASSEPGGAWISGDEAVRDSVGWSHFPAPPWGHSQVSCSSIPDPSLVSALSTVPKPWEPFPARVSLPGSGTAGAQCTLNELKSKETL